MDRLTSQSHFALQSHQAMARGTQERRATPIATPKEKPTIKIQPQGSEPVKSSFMDNVQFTLRLFFRGNRFWTRTVATGLGILAFFGGISNVHFVYNIVTLLVYINSSHEGASNMTMTHRLFLKKLEELNKKDFRLRLADPNNTKYQAVITPHEHGFPKYFKSYEEEVNFLESLFPDMVKEDRKKVNM